MKNLNPEFCKNIKLARREAGLTQGQLAAEVGCKQSALSMFEQGDGTKLNDEVIEKLAKKFNLSLTPSVSPAQVNTPPLPHFPTPPLHRGFCPNPHCPTNKEYFVEDSPFWGIAKTGTWIHSPSSFFRFALNQIYSSVILRILMLPSYI